MLHERNVRLLQGRVLLQLTHSELWSVASAVDQSEEGFREPALA